MRIAVCLTLAAAAFSAWPQAVNDFPAREDPLNVRAERFGQLVRGNHLNEGIVLPMVVFPPAGSALPSVGRHENAALETGLYLAALSHEYAVTQSPETRALADQVMDGILKLEKVTGQDGCVARSFYKAEGPSWHERCFFIPAAWRDSASMAGYRWLGMMGTDHLAALIAGIETYWDLCADSAHRKIAAAFVDRVMGHCIENNMRIVEPNGKTSLFGNASPDLPHEPAKSLHILSSLKIALKLTGKVAYHAAYNRLIVRYRYDDEVILARDLASNDTSGDRPAALALQSLIQNEDNSGIRPKYLAGLNRYWHVWRQGGDPFFAMVYEKVAGEKTIDEARLNAIKALWDADRQRGTWRIDTPEGVQTVEAESEESPVPFLHAYWYGRHAGVIAPEW
ncbi:MAG TPA: hypothetical protein PKO36_01530 [Candidatus Hydrogenedentes bacterium]|nr:hypothetical protein [Candidatus Hydrogenedentota bacterium]HOT50611.1 hypothetical protein [Candidatus Hydrogenedentota bacterium]HOV74248.1 hypothetical protein [Candidatus Hydrogenedentota bacterium]HPC15058.1 hypothetical protein [Candidatus Hydrogenedentota bacterium]HRT19081.1 hypothetical protein [Candidatus Hydrogenedentota bacterium]